MSAQPRNVFAGFLSGRFSILLLSVALMFFILPLLPADRALFDKQIKLFGFIVLISCLRAISVNKLTFRFLIFLAFITIGGGSALVLGTYDAIWIQTTVLLLRLIFYLIVFGSIMRYVLDRSPVCLNKICGAISAYILMGIIWSVIYTLFYLLQPESFIFPEAMQKTTPSDSWPIYFSFTTLTTLGYGDITPNTPATQVYSFMQAACGQIYLAVIIARLVALQITHNQEET